MNSSLKIAVGGRADSEPVTMVEPGHIDIQFKPTTVAFEGDEKARWAACQERLLWASTQITEDLLIAGEVPIYDANGVVIGAITHNKPSPFPDGDFVSAMIEFDELFAAVSRRPGSMMASVTALALAREELVHWAQRADPTELNGTKNFDCLREYSMLNGVLTPASHNYLFLEGVSDAEVYALGVAQSAPSRLFVSVDPKALILAKHALRDNPGFDSISVRASACEIDRDFDGNAIVRVNGISHSDVFNCTLILDDHMGTYELTLDDSLKTDQTQMPSAEVRAALLAAQEAQNDSGVEPN